MTDILEEARDAELTSIIEGGDKIIDLYKGSNASFIAFARSAGDEVVENKSAKEIAHRYEERKKSYLNALDGFVKRQFV